MATACFVRWERFAKDPRQLGKGALAAAPELPKIIVRFDYEEKEFEVI
jgi:hypothetical protein